MRDGGRFIKDNPKCLSSDAKDLTDEEKPTPSPRGWDMVDTLLKAEPLLRGEGESLFRENIFENRFRHVPQLKRLGAQIRLEGREALVTGVERLDGAAVESTDLRGGAAMILAGLQARGETLVWDRGHVRRGYEDLDGTLRSLGAEITYEGDSHGIFV